MKRHGNITMSRKAESIYTAMKKHYTEEERQNKIFVARQRLRSFEEDMERNEATRVGYASINGISMPVLSA